MARAAQGLSKEPWVATRSPPLVKAPTPTDNSTSVVRGSLLLGKPRDMASLGQYFPELDASRRLCLLPGAGGLAAFAVRGLASYVCSCLSSGADDIRLETGCHPFRHRKRRDASRRPSHRTRVWRPGLGALALEFIRGLRTALRPADGTPWSRRYRKPSFESNSDTVWSMTL